MKHNTIYFLVKQLQDEIKIAKFKSDWRKINKHNLTVPMNIWPIDKVSVGKYTYGNFECHFFGTNDNSEYIRIGNACSIASDTKFIAGGEHKFSSLTMFPYFQKYINKKDYAAVTKGPIIVEDEVWIGKGCLILSGVTIEKGAVVAAGSVVTRNVPSFSIVGGSPARVIKYRFDQETIEKLKDVDFSSFDLNKIKYNKELFTRDIGKENIDDEIDELQKLKG